MSDSIKDAMPVKIGGRPYMMQLSGYQRAPVDSQRQMVDQGEEPGEQSLSNRGIWKRTGEDFVGGAGQTFFDHAKVSARNRFRQSAGVDPWTHRRLTLLRQTRAPKTTNAMPNNVPPLVGGDTIHTTTAANHRLIGCAPPGAAGASRLYWQAADRVYQVDDPMAASWVMTAVTGGAIGGGYDFVSMTTDGQRIFACCTDTFAAPSIQVITDTTMAAFGAVRADLVAYCNGRLLATSKNTIFELDNAGVKLGGVDIFSHWQTSFVWKCLVGAPNGIYCGGNDGHAGQIFLATIADATGAVTAPFPVGELPDGELLVDIAHYAGILVLSTSKGVRLANVSGGGFLSIGPLVPVGGEVRHARLAAPQTNLDTTITLSPSADAVLGSVIAIGQELQLIGSSVSAGVWNVTRGYRGTAASTYAAGEPYEITNPYRGGGQLECQGQFTWYCWANPEYGITGLGRLNLAEFTEPLLPAYARDVTTSSRGPTAWPGSWVDPVSGLDFRFFELVGGLSTSGPYIETQARVGAGDLYTGGITFATPEKKAYVSFEVWTDPLPTNCFVTAYIWDSAGNVTTLGSSGGVGQRHFKWQLPTVEDEWVEVQLRLTTTNVLQTMTPAVQRWTMRSVPLPFPSEELRVPVTIKSEVLDDRGNRIGLDPWTEWNFLHNLYVTQARTTFEMGNETATVRIDGLEIKNFDPKTAHMTSWTENEDWVEGTWFVTLLTVDNGT